MLFLIAVVFFCSAVAIVNCDDSLSLASQKLLAACMGPEEDVATVQALLQGDEVNINAKDPASGQTPLMASVLRGKTALADLLLQHGADASISEKDGYTPSHGAAFQGRTAVLKVLDKYGVAPQEYHKDGYLPFHRACWGRTERHAEFVKYMLQSGLVNDVDVESKNGLTCREMTSNPETLQVLKEFSQTKNEL